MLARKGSCKVNCNRRKEFPGKRGRGNDSLRESGRLFIHSTRMGSANLVFAIVAYCTPVDVTRDVVKSFLGSHVCHPFISKAEDFTSDIVSFVGCFIGNLWTV